MRAAKQSRPRSVPLPPPRHPGPPHSATVVTLTQRLLIDWRGHWGWDFLFVLIYAMFLDRWLKESLLDGATDCDEKATARWSYNGGAQTGEFEMRWMLCSSVALPDRWPAPSEIPVPAG